MRNRIKLPAAAALALGILLLFSLALAEQGGSCGKEIAWSYADGTIEVLGKGAMDDGAFWQDSVGPGEIRRVTIGNGVTRIGENAFLNCENLSRVTLPDSLTAIGEGAFEGCKSLKSISLPENITEIGFRSFSEETGHLELPALRTATGMTLGTLDKPFYLPGDKNAYVHYHTETGEYVGLTLYKPLSKKAESVVFPEGLDCIREGFFEGMSSLKSIRIPDSMTKLALSEFAGIYRECVILCGKGSAAEKFCLEKGLQFDNGERRVVGYDITGEKKKVSWIIKNYIRSGMSEKQKAQVLHNWLTTNSHYFDDGSTAAHESKTLLLKGYGVCEAYAEAYCKLLSAAGIASTDLGAQIMEHAWNIVRINNKWYHVDCTWDDPTNGPARYPCVSGREKNQYFLLTDKQIKKDHKWEDKYVSADRGRPGNYIEPYTGKRIYLELWKGTNSYVLDWDKHTATVLGPAFGTETRIVIPATFSYENVTWKVTAVDDGAFRKNGKIQEVVIGKNVQQIGKNAFRDCAKLMKITFKTGKLTADTVGQEAFSGLSEKAVIRCPEKVLKAYKKLLRQRGVPKKVNRKN